MALLQAKSPHVKHAQDRRRYQRVRVNLLGRYMLSDRQEYPCQVVNMSPGGMALIAPTIGQVGERVIACPVPVANRLLIRGEQHLYCIGEK